MRDTFFIFLISLFTYTSSLAQEKLTSFVDPFIGIGAHGNTSPGAVVPNGKVQVTPYNGGSGSIKTSRYHYDNNKINGFNHVDLAGFNNDEWLDISVMPLLAPLKGQDTILAAATFSHQRESAVPGYYSVELDNKIRVELTTTDRISYHRYTFPAGSEPAIRFEWAAQKAGDRMHETFLQKENDSTLVGYRITPGTSNNEKLYFAARTSKNIREFRLKGEIDIEAGDINIGLKSEEGEAGVTSQLVFNPTSIPETIELKVALSANSLEEALETLEDVPDWNFNTVRAQASADWEDELARIRITSSDIRLKRIFYTALYHAVADPQSLSSRQADRILPSPVIDSTRVAGNPPSADRQRLRQQVDSVFQDKPDEYREDAGVSPLWAVWTILGLYDANGSRGEYHITSPLIDKAVIDVNNGNQFEIEVLNNGPENRYVRSLKLNGSNYKKDYLLHTDLIKGGKLTVSMGAESARKRDDDQENIPSAEKKDIFKSIGDFFKNIFK